MKKLWPVFLVLILSWFAVVPLFQPGFFSMHDDTQVARVFEMTKALKDGQFPVRFVQDLGYGYGYPLFNFYAPLPYYFSAFLTLLGINVLTATKLMFLVGILLSGFFMYQLGRLVWGELGGILAAIFYLYAPYHALDIYVRGAVGEFWAMAFLPLVFWKFASFRKREKRNWKKVFWSGLSYACLILSHNLTALIATPFLILWIMFWSRSKDSLSVIRYSSFVLLFGLSLSCFYWLPALLEIKFIDTPRLIKGGGGDYSLHFVFLDQLWDWPWGFAGSGPGRADGMSFKIGKLHLIVAFLSSISAMFGGRKSRLHCYLVILLSCYLVVSIFFTLQVSQPFWQILPFLPFLQYPWRFLTLTTFFVSFLGGGSVFWLSLISQRGAVLLTIFLIILIIFFNAKLFLPQKFYPPQRDYTSFKAIAWEASRLSDEYLPKGFKIPKDFSQVPKEKFVLEEGEGEIVARTIKSHFYSFIVLAKTDVKIRVNTIWFPGFQGWVDNEKVEIKRREDGLMELKIPSGKHKVVLQLTETRERSFANFLSLFSFLGGAWFMLESIYGRGKRATESICD